MESTVSLLLLFLYSLNFCKYYNFRRLRTLTSSSHRGLETLQALLGAEGPSSQTLQTKPIKFGANLTSNGWYNFFVPFLCTRKAVVPLANDHFMLGTLIQLFRHLKHQNLSTSDDIIYSSGIIYISSIFGHLGGSDTT